MKKPNSRWAQGLPDMSYGPSGAVQEKALCQKDYLLKRILSCVTKK